MKDKEIKMRIKQHYEAVLASGVKEKNLLGIFLYGSQNYGTDTCNSDVDTKAIVIPTFEDLCLNTPVSKEIHLENGEHCEIKDIREIVKNFRKQNINFIEILYTDYFILNPRYEELWKHYFIDNREIIAHYDINKCVQSICGQAIHTLKQNKTDGKKYSNGLRLKYFLKHYINKDKYANCLYPPIYLREDLIKYKTGQLSIEESQTDALILEFEKMRNEKYYSSFNCDTIDITILDKGILMLVQRNLFDF
jgi:predicted nucleotidyltransferase